MTGALLWGKLPAHGDFVARGLDPALRDALDRWLAASLVQARDDLGEQFEETYDEAPPWRFVWSGEGGWTAGAMAPSTDGVGRRYPVLLALTGLDEDHVERAADLAEGLLYDALAGDWDADRLHAAAAALLPEPLAAWQGGERWWTLGAEHFNDADMVGARPAALMRAMLTRVALDEDAGGQDEG